MGVRTANVQDGNIGETLESLAATIHGRRESSPEESYKDHDHIRYEAGDLVYHLLVTLERYGVTLDELAGELNARMK